MNDFVLNRIKSQLQASKKIENTSAPERTHVEEPEKVAPLDPQEFKTLLMEELGETRTPETPPVPPNGERVFNGIEDFVTWYEPLQEKFSEGQRVALKTLIDSKAAINIGCGCKRGKRKRQAEDYFSTFWNNNLTTDLPVKVLEVGNYSAIIFEIDGKPFLRFPTPENNI
jgi:hypothetical protein